MMPQSPLPSSQRPKTRIRAASAASCCRRRWTSWRTRKNSQWRKCQISLTDSYKKSKPECDRVYIKRMCTCVAFCLSWKRKDRSGRYVRDSSWDNLQSITLRYFRVFSFTYCMHDVHFYSLLMTQPPSSLNWAAHSATKSSLNAEHCIFHASVGFSPGSPTTPL